MLRPLLTHFWLYTALLLANFANGQSVVAESNAGICNCVGSDQFVSTIKLNSLSANEGGWIIQNFINVYQPTVLAPSAPVAITGMMNVSTDANMCHTFTFMHQVGEIFSFQITNGTTTFQVPGNLPFAGCTYTPVPLACNNNVNVSVDQFCEAEITPDMVLEDPFANSNLYDISVYNSETGEVFGSMLGSEHLGLPLKVEVTHICSGNSCWGNLNLEDKFIPNLLCEDVTINCEASTNPGEGITPFPFAIADPGDLINLGNNCWQLTTLDQCGSSMVCFEDIVNELECDDGFASMIERTWTLMGASGREVSCTQNVYVNFPDLALIEFPENFDIPDNGLNCKDKDSTGPNGWISLPNGHPSPETTGIPQGIGNCGNLQVTYVDVVFEECGSSTFKIKREWHIFDRCQNDFISHNQFISVSDFDPPIVVCAIPLGTEIFVNDPHQCVADYTPPAPNVIFECSAYDYTIEYKTGVALEDCTDPITNDPGFRTDGIVRNADGSYTISGLEGGCNWIKYIVTDECGNETFLTCDIVVKEEIPPTAVCDHHTVVSLNEDGFAWATAHSFDDGSHDNCSVDRLEVRRIGSNSCGGGSAWGETVQFCCRDLGQAVMVELRVFDANGNVSDQPCMAEAWVQDNFDPVFAFCPPDTVIDCGDDIENLSRFGTAQFDDACSSGVEVDVVFDLSTCGTGFIHRTFYPTGGSPNGNSCTQTIEVYEIVLPERFILWPEDFVIDGCLDVDLDPDNLPLLQSRPIVKEKPCQQLALSFEDLVLQFPEDGCRKVLRQWTIADWCGIAQGTNPGTFTNTQVIIINDADSPQITQGCNNSTVTGEFVSGCTYSVDLSADANDSCTSSDLLTWTVTIDRGNDGSINQTLFDNDITTNLEVGSNLITWTVTDDCGNSTMCSQIITVRDNEAPTPLCLLSIVSVINKDTGETQILANDFQNKSVDNCSSDNSLTYSFSPNVNDISRTFTCADLGGVSRTTFEIDIFVTDNAGNSDFCTALVDLQDNNDFCGFAGNGGGAAVACDAIEVSWEDPVVFDCDGVFTFEAIGGTESTIIINDAEGEDCGPCTSLTANGCSAVGGSECGNSSSRVLSNPIDLSLYNGVTVEYTITANGEMECNGCTSDDFVAIILNTSSGGFNDNFSACGLVGSTSGSFEINSGCDEDLFIMVQGGTQAQNETYTIEITVCGEFNEEGPFVVNGIAASPDLACLGVDVQLLADVSNCPACTYLWEGPNGFSSNQQNPTISNIDGTMGEASSYIVTITDPNGCEYVGGTAVFILTEESCSTGNISGLILNENSDEVADVEVTLSAHSIDTYFSEMTGDDGAYAFEAIEMYEDYTVAPIKNGDYLNGVSTVDLVLIQQHILGIKSFDSAYKVIASDANNSQSVTAADLIQLRKLILGLIDELPSNSSWRFVESNQVFTDIQKPFPFSDKISLNDFEQDILAADFMAVKIGDVNGSAVANNFANTEIRNQEEIQVGLSFKKLTATSTMLTLSLDNELAIQGFQFHLDYNKENIELLKVGNDKLGLNSAHYNILKNRDTGLVVSWNNNSTEAINTTGVITIEFEHQQGLTNFSELFQLNELVLNAELYHQVNGELMVKSIKLIENDLAEEYSTIDDDLILFQNNPNPFSAKTTIAFQLKQSGPFVLDLLDTQGRLIYQEKGLGNKGLNEVSIDLSDKYTQGIIYYRMETNGSTATKKMILLK